MATLSDRGRIHQTHCTKRSVWGLLNHQTLVYIIKDFFINFIRRRTVWLHKSQDIWATRAYSFLNCIWQGFFKIFILHVSLAKLVNIVRYAKLHNKISFRRDQISNFSSVYGFLFHSSGYFFETLLKQCKAKKCFFDVIIRKKNYDARIYACWIMNCQGSRKIQCAWFFTHLNLSYESLM